LQKKEENRGIITKRTPIEVWKNAFEYLEPNKEKEENIKR
jgi:hypothetical protein